MIEQWREYLYFFGFLSSIAFGSRFLVQWIASEIKKQSIIPPSFWRLSLAGNCLLLIHSFLQLQLHVVFVQTCNAVISWRNLNLLKPPEKRISWKQTCLLLAFSLTAILLLFVLQAWYLPGENHLFRIPVTPWNSSQENSVGLGWHIAGSIGLLLFNSRFWVQWWCSERRGSSYVGPVFWWISLIGDGLCLTYFFHLGDVVNLIGPIFGMVPYIRNLILIYKTPKSVQPESLS